MELNAVSQEVRQFLIRRFGFMPIDSSIVLHDRQGWQNFCSYRGFDTSQEGVYIPRDCSAHLLQDSEFILQNLFHEYFGHGMYTEHSLVGRQIQSLEQRLMEEENRAGIDSPEKRSELRQNSKIYSALGKIRQQILPQYEGFALWMEWYLSNMNGNRNGFEEKLKKFSPEQQALCKRFTDYSREYGEHALMFSTGLPKYYNQGILTEILQKIFQDDFGSIRFAMVYGSRKPYSDIDLFMVSDRLPCTHFGWLDIYSVTSKVFDDLISKFDISISDPLFTGEMVCGDKGIVEQTKAKLLSSAIAPDAIRFHRQHAEIAKETALQYGEDSSEYQTALRYNRSYLANAKELEQGRKPLTLKNLIALYPELFAGFKVHYSDKDINTENNGGI